MSLSSLGALSILFGWAGLFFLIWKWKGNGSMTFSQHAAQKRQSILYYMLLWVIVLPPFYWFMMNPFADKLHLGLTFKIFVSLASLFMLLAALIPELPGWKFKAHRFVAFSMAVLLIPVLLFILASSNVSLLSRVTTISSLSYMVWSIVYIWLETATKQKVQEHPRMLLLQATYVAVFHLSILVAYYI